MPELSIIVPVYKVEPYLPKCIDSILAQTFSDFELILIDDGSPDRCGEICDEYAARDDRVVVIHRENRGVSAARNAGLDAARGEYIGFVDSDDWIEPEMYQTLVIAAMDRNASLTACSYCLNDAMPAQTDETPVTEAQFRGRKQLLLDLFSKPSRLLGTCCTKVFARSTIGSTRFIEGLAIWEDLVFLQSCYLRDEDESLTAVKLRKCLYHYRVNAASATNSVRKVRYGKKEFKHYIFRELLDCDRECAVKALIYFLDSSIQLMRQYRKASSERWTRKVIFEIRRHILYWVVRSLFQRLLPRTQRQRYLVEGVLKPQ